jgi:hypothetical protein
VIAAGVGLGLAWLLLAPLVVAVSDDHESAVARDGAFALLSLAAGMVTVIRLGRRPGASSPVPVGLTILGSLAAALLADLVGWLAFQASGPSHTVVGLATAGPVRARAVLLVWPLVVSIWTFTRSGLDLMDGEPTSAAHARQGAAIPTDQPPPTN